jgi:hypothetical protein
MHLLLSVVRDVQRLWLVFFQGILGDDEGLVAVDARIDAFGAVVKARRGGDDAKGLNNGSEEAVTCCCNRCRRRIDALGAVDAMIDALVQSSRLAEEETMRKGVASTARRRPVA